MKKEDKKMMDNKDITVNGPIIRVNLEQDKNIYHKKSMIHFQYDEPGACIRGSELKPKLDNFIINNKNVTIQDIWRLNPEKEKPGYNALNYKVKIYVNGCNIINKKKSITYKNGITMEIICFNEDLKKCIKNNLVNFFENNKFGGNKKSDNGKFKVKDKEVKE